MLEEVKNTPKLFAVMLGGRALGCNIELHDIVFVTGHSLEATHSQLIKKWFGVSDSVHIDSSVELNYIDHYKIELKPYPQNNFDKKLFFVNFGGYQPGFFGELHEVGFFAAENKKAAISQAKQKLCQSLAQHHKDDCVLLEKLNSTGKREADDIIEIQQVDSYHIHLIEDQTAIHPLQIKSFYRRISSH